MIRNGFYIIKDSFFSDMSDPYLKGNKKQNRPHYYCFEDSNYNGIYWMIPLSSRIDKYKKIVSKRTGKGRTCDIIHIVKLDDNHESAFLIQDMFPISEKYIEREYTIAGNHLRLTSEHAAKEIEQKSKKSFGNAEKRNKIYSNSTRYTENIWEAATGFTSNTFVIL